MMMNIARTLVAMVYVLVGATAALAQQKDVAGCKDHPMFTRMPEYWIYKCVDKQFDAHAFVTGKGQTETIEGRKATWTYYPQAKATEKPSELQIKRNFEAAIQKAGGKVVGADKGRETFTLTADGKEIWVEVWAEFTGKYGFTIVEKKAMAQDIIATAEVFSNDIRSTGHAAIYGIYFDSGKSVIKPESDVALTEIAKLLNGDPGLKINVVGHTDNVGQMDYNMKLSQARAEAVAQALVAKHGISAARLKGYGVSSLAPVSTNDTDEGRAKNRRVELVKQ
jgi:outer membrane protein OmpA-like peptidoglycan-associated protein